MSWISVGLIVGGTAASAGGSIISSNSALKNAQAQAAAENAILQQSEQKQAGYSAQTEGDFNSNLAKYTPDAQAAQLASAQGSRGAANVAAITGPDTSTPANAPAADTQDLAKRMGAVLDYAKTNAQNQGNLSGYGDTWLENNLNNAETNRQMAPVEQESQLEASLLPERQTIAGAGAYTTPSLWGPLLQGAGSIAASAGGAGFGAAGGLSGPAWGGGNALTDVWGGSASSPLPGLTAADYG